MNDIRPILASLRRHKITAVLMVLQIALTCAVVCNAVFLIGQRLDRLSMTSGTAESELVDIVMGGIGKRPDVLARAQEDMAAMRGVPGVTSATMMNQLPFGVGGSSSSVGVTRDQPFPTTSATTYLGEHLIQTLGLKLVAGRDFEPGEYTWVTDYEAGTPGAQPTTAIVTKALAAALFPGQDPLGREFFVEKDGIRIVGVVEQLTAPNPSRKDGDSSILLPVRMNSASQSGLDFVLRTSPQDRQRVLDAATAKLRQVDPRRIVVYARTFEKVRRDYQAGDRSTVTLLAAVSLALLGVTALGIVGLASFWVTQRRRQIGVRRALGARRRDIMVYFQTENFLLASFGIGLGMVLAYAINLVLMLNYELPRLPWTYLPVGAILLWLLGQLAVFAPARRAAAVPPIVATRG
ncbi:MAG: FtsX-like permease family protein [Luteibacter sp.]